MLRITPTTAVRLWGLGFAGAALALGLDSRRVAAGTTWGPSGWQSEIVIWNVGTIASLVALERDRAHPELALTTGYTVLSALFAVNHLRAVRRAPLRRTTSHWGAALANLGGVAIGLRALSEGARPA